MTEQERIIITKYDLLYEQRMTRVETTLEGMDKMLREGFKEMKIDFRWLVLIMLGGFGTLFGIMANGYKRKIDNDRTRKNRDHKVRSVL